MNTESPGSRASTPEHPDNDRLIAYALGDLEAGEREPLDLHLNGCNAAPVR